MAPNAVNARPVLVPGNYVYSMTYAPLLPPRPPPSSQARNPTGAAEKAVSRQNEGCSDLHLGETAYKADGGVSVVPRCLDALSHTPGLEASPPGRARRRAPPPLVAAALAVGLADHDVVPRPIAGRTLGHG